MTTPPWSPCALKTNVRQAEPSDLSSSNSVTDPLMQGAVRNSRGAHHEGRFSSPPPRRDRYSSPIQFRSPSRSRSPPATPPRRSRFNGTRKTPMAPRALKKSMDQVLERDDLMEVVEFIAAYPNACNQPLLPFDDELPLQWAERNGCDPAVINVLRMHTG
jgi:hypothetical protein